MENVEISKKKKLKRVKIFLMIFVIISILAITLLYFNNKTFKNKVNNLLGKMPGRLGEYFSSSSKDADYDIKKTYLTEYYLSLDPDVAADKLYILKKDDEKLYSEIIRLMNSSSSSKTEEIIKLVRNMELRKDLLSSIYNEIIKEKENQVSDEITRLESEDLLVVINEIENKMSMDSNFKENLTTIFSGMNEERVTDILYYIDADIKEDILYSLSDNKRTNLESKLSVRMADKSRLVDLARLYETKPVEEVLEEIGNSGKYSMGDLATIYRNLTVLKSAQILSKVEEDSFIKELFTFIRREEELEGEKESITNEINKAIQFITEYNRKIDDLVAIYNKMSPDKVARIVERMMANNTTVTALEINSEPVFEISDASIIIDVIAKMKNKTLSSIMDYMSANNASKLTQMLARP